jgi:hypothetical protein
MPVIDRFQYVKMLVAPSRNTIDVASEETAALHAHGAFLVGAARNAALMRSASLQSTCPDPHPRL